MTTTRTAKAKKINVQSLTEEVKGKAQAAYAKGTAVAGELGAMTKDNLTAVVASGKILGAGLKEMGEAQVAEGKTAFETLVADFKSFTAVKSPAELLQLQMKLAKRNIDTAVLAGTKSREAFTKLASETVAPLSNQVKANVAKIRAAA